MYKGRQAQRRIQQNIRVPIIRSLCVSDLEKLMFVKHDVLEKNPKKMFILGLALSFLGVCLHIL